MGVPRTTVPEFPEGTVFSVPCSGSKYFTYEEAMLVNSDPFQLLDHLVIP